MTHTLLDQYQGYLFPIFSRKFEIHALEFLRNLLPGIIACIAMYVYSQLHDIEQG